MFPSVRVTVPVAVDSMAPTTLTETLTVMDCPTVKDLGVAVHRVFVWKRNGVEVRVTVSIASPVMPLRLAVMEEVPIARAVARPVAEVVATEGLSDVQITSLVKFSVELFEKLPVAVNCSVAPTVMCGLAGVTVIDWRIGVGGVAVRTVEPVMPSRLAVMEEVPVARALARPVAEMVATEGVADAQVTWLVRFSVESSEKRPVAVNCWAPPMGMLGLAGVTVIDWRVTGGL